MIDRQLEERAKKLGLTIKSEVKTITTQEFTVTDKKGDVITGINNLEEWLTGCEVASRWNGGPS